MQKEVTHYFKIKIYEYALKNNTEYAKFNIMPLSSNSRNLNLKKHAYLIQHYITSTIIRITLRIHYKRIHIL